MGLYQTGQARPDWQQQMPQGQAADTDAASASTPGFGTTFGAKFNAEKDSNWFVEHARVQDAYRNLATQLASTTGTNRDAYYNGDTQEADPNLIWQAINARRQSDPNFLQDVGANDGEFRQRVLTRGGQHAIDAATAAAGGWIPNLLGSAATMAYDPIQVGLAFTGGPEINLAARGILINGLARLGSAAATNAAMAGVEEPLTIQARTNIGEQTSAGDVASDIGGAAVFGGALHLGGEALGAVARPILNAGQNALESGLTKAYSALPDSVLQQHFADKTAPWERTPEEAAALNVLGRQAELDATNPYQPSYAAMAVHQVRLGEAGAALDDGRAPGAGPAFQAPPSQGVTSGYYAKLGQAENASGNPNASPGTSSARGLYQFTDGTWLHMYKARFGAAGHTDTQILAMKTDPGLQNTLVRDLTQHNADFLQRHNVPPNDANLYLAHFAGPDGAVRVVNADPSASAADILGPRATEANPWLRNKTAGELRAWAERKMGGQDAATAGAVDTAGATPDDGSAELARSDAEDAGMEADEAMMPVDQAPSPSSDMPPGPMPAAPVARDEELPLSVQMLLPTLREVVADRAVKLNDHDALAEKLGASTEDVRAGLNELVQAGALRQRSDTGAFMRHPQASSGPEDVLTFLARMGGIRDDEGHNLGLKRIGAVGDAVQAGAAPVAGDMSTGARAAMEARGRFGTLDWGRVMTRGGRLLRRSGRSLDQVGEALHEAGYMIGDRPTTAEVIDFLDKRIKSGKPAFTMEDQARMGANDGLYRQPGRDERMTFARDQIYQAARAHFGIEPDALDDEFLDHAAALNVDKGISSHDAFVHAINDFSDQVRHEAMDEKDIPAYRNIDHEWPDHPRPAGEDLPSEEDLARRRPLTSDEAARDGGAEAAGSSTGQGSGPLDPEAFAEYSEPDSPRIAQAADSAWHDIEQAHTIDPAIDEREKQRTQLAAEAPLRKPVAQEGTMGLGLFDASDQPVFDLGTGDAATKIQEVQAALESDQTALDTISSCLKPKMGGA